MESPLAPVFANIIMTELKKVVVQKLTTSGMITFYCRYVGDTLLLVKLADILCISYLFNKFNKNSHITVDRFEREVTHFLDIKIYLLGPTIYRKNTHTGQYVNFESYTPWHYKINWIRSPVTRAKQIFRADLLPAEI